MSNPSTHCIPKYLLVTLAIVLSVFTCLAWFYSLIPFITLMIPYAFALSLVIFTTTSVQIAICKLCRILRWYAPLVIVNTVIFMVFCLICMAGNFTFPLIIVLMVIGSLSFWIMLFAFTAMILCMIKRR